MVTPDPSGPEIDKWLRSLDPTREWVLRDAILRRYSRLLATNREFAMRMDQLTHQLGVGGSLLDQLLAESLIAQGNLDQQLMAAIECQRRAAGFKITWIALRRTLGLFTVLVGCLASPPFFVVITLAVLLVLYARSRQQGN
jgi:hypothetical protein